MKLNMCVHCHVVEAQNYGNGKYYCTFCHTRLSRIRRMYARVGMKLSVRKMHHAQNYWKRTAALDVMYLDPIERAAA